jgi:hypothetical protein
MINKEDMKPKRGRGVLFKAFLPLIFITVISFSAANHFFKFVEEEKLVGASADTVKPQWDFGSYLNGEYQKNFEDWYFLNFSLRGNAIKQYSQMKYSLFNTSPNENVVRGKEEVLFEKEYIEEYLGIEEPVAQEYLIDLTNDIKFIEDKCKEFGKEFYLIITPSKADFYSDSIPDKYYKIASVKGINNEETRDYNRFIKLLKEKDIRYFDTKDYLMEKREELGIPLYAKTGIHWNYVSAAYSLQRFIEISNNTSKLNLKNFGISNVQQSETPFHSDDIDIYSIMNVPKGKMDELYYSPEIKSIANEGEDNNKSKPKVFMEGGSFSWQLLQFLNNVKTFSNIDFLYYQLYITHFSTREITKTPVDGKVTKEVLDRVLSNKDMLILEVNQQYISNMGRGFPKVLRNYLEQYGFPID